MFKKISIIVLVAFIFVACKKQNQVENHEIQHGVEFSTTYATGFKVVNYNGYSTIHIKSPWPNSDKSFTYLLVDKGKNVPEHIAHDALIHVPVEKVIVTSTTHIPILEALNELDKLVGFPNTNFISSEKARDRIGKGIIKELGENEALNTELVLDLEPDVVIGFAINGNNKTFNTLQKSGIPVVYDAAWIEKHALGRAEWIKFFGCLFKKEEKANQVFNQIVSNYAVAKNSIADIVDKPSVLAGSMFKDIWHVPYGNSWAAQFIADAGGNYLWGNTLGSGSIALNIESVLTKGKQADFWFTLGSATTKQEFKEGNKHYIQFDAFINNNVYIANKKGATGGLFFYELGPNRPDLILKDLIKIMHPDRLPNHELFFYQQLQ